MFVDHCSEEEEEGEKEVESDASYHPKEEGPVLDVEEVHVGEDDVRHLKQSKFMLDDEI